MARMIPEFNHHIEKAPSFRKTGSPELDRGRKTEQELYVLLRDLLPDDWVVRYNFEFTRKAEELIEHEADFVVVIPRCGILVLEVKASESYGLRNGVWFSDPACRRVREGNPFAQARSVSAPSSISSAICPASVLSSMHPGRRASPRLMVTSYSRRISRTSS